MLEHYEKQYAESAAAHSELSKRSEHGRKVGPPKPKSERDSHSRLEQSLELVRIPTRTSLPLV